jgi:protein-tyrosine phosphatase
MMQWAGENRDVSDPWYTRNFESAYQDILRACQGILDKYKQEFE